MYKQELQQIIMKKFINVAMNEALKSNQNFKHGAVLVHNNKIISKGYNHSNGKDMPHHMWSIHAEMDAVLSSNVCVKLQDYVKLYVVRITPTGLAESKPCAKCQKFMKRFNVSRVFYSTCDQNIDTMYLAP